MSCRTCGGNGGRLIDSGEPYGDVWEDCADCAISAAWDDGASLTPGALRELVDRAVATVDAMDDRTFELAVNSGLLDRMFVERRQRQRAKVEGRCPAECDHGKIWTYRSNGPWYTIPCDECCGDSLPTGNR